MELNEAQLKAVSVLNGNVAVIATAGSGKTAVLIKRIEKLIKEHNVHSYNILAVTFSKKAKETIQKRLEKLDIEDVNVETFHSLALKIIKAKYKDYYTVWTSAWEKEKLIQDICSNLGLCDKNEIPYNEICKFIAVQKVNMIKNNKLVYCEEQPFPANDMFKIYTLYEDFKSKNRYIEFDDFLNIANDILDTDDKLLLRYQEQFTYILSDEFQDVSMSQFLLLNKLNNKNTMIVGDPLQAIYSFRGGDSKYILNFDQLYKNTSIINLNTNYRCSQEIVTTANELAKHIPDSQHRYYVESIANNPSNKKPVYTLYSNEYDEANNIAKKIIHLTQQGYKLEDMAILARTNAQLTKVQSILHNKGIGFDVVDGKLFTELPEIKLLISYLKLASDVSDNDSFEFLYNKPNRWLDKKFLQEVKEYSSKNNLCYYYSMEYIIRRNWKFKNGINEIQEVIRCIKKNDFENIGEIIAYLRNRLNIDAFVTKGKQADDGSYCEQIENMNAFQNIAEKFTSMKKFILYLNEIQNDIENNYTDKVKLSTIHKAKGLEYPIVFVIGCNNGILPHEKSKDINDEKRLFYVAITRAEKELYLSSTLSYNKKFYTKSSFIDDIKETITETKYDREY